MDFLGRSQTARSRTLGFDLERLENGEVAASPLLDDRPQRLRLASCLEGVVKGHPSLADGQVILTNKIWAQFHDQGEHLVRKLNRWYRLVRRRNASADGLPSLEGRRR